MRRELLGVVLVLAAASLVDWAVGTVGVAQNLGDASLPSSQDIERGIDGLGKKAPVAVVRSMDRGYDPQQVVGGLAASRLARDGQIASGGEPVVPAGPPVGLIKRNGAEGGEVSVNELATAATRVAKKASGLQRIFEAGEFGATQMIVLARLNGYTPEQIILDMLLADAPAGVRILEKTKLEKSEDANALIGQIILVDKEGKLVPPEGTPIPHGALQKDWIKEGRGAGSDTKQKPRELQPGEELRYSGTGFYTTVTNVDDSTCVDEKAPVDVIVSETGRVTLTITETLTHFIDDHTCRPIPANVQIAYLVGKPASQCAGTKLCVARPSPGYETGVLRYDGTSIGGTYSAEYQGNSSKLVLAELERV